MFPKQPGDDEAKQEDQSEEGSHGDHGQNDGEQFEVESWHLTPDVTEQNKDSQVLRDVH